jgi:arginyl-tRNA--protein-N-Asp/Glu arginylyltransferase
MRSSDPLDDMSSLDFAMMVEDTHIDTVLTEYRVRGGTGDQPGSGPLLAVCLTDRLADGLSLVYPSTIPTSRAGRYVILDHIEKARRLGLPHV